MVHSNLQQTRSNIAPESARDIDPNVRQRTASNPEASVWVNASAGTGKTKVLTDRVLRLLMPRENGQPGTKPHKILCLTFTKAGAGEMALRLNQTLGQWAVMEEEKLADSLSKLLTRTARPEDIATARRLFAEVTDTPGGLKIMTIHAFCQSVLSRFPLEAGLLPNFSVLEEGQALLLLELARAAGFSKAKESPASPLAEALDNIAQNVNEEQFAKLLRDLVAERHQFSALRRKHFGVDGLYTKTCQLLGVEPGQSANTLLQQACHDEHLDRQGLAACARIMQEQGTKTDQKHAKSLTQWFALTLPQRVEHFSAYQSVFLTTEGKKRAKLCSTKLPENIHTTLSDEANRLLKLIDQMNAVLCATLTRDLLRLGETILESYESIKQQKAALDFDDLILKTTDLLKQESGAAWVMFKLDQGLDHILIDEAQDTNPEQWEIIAALCDEFFSGQGQSDVTRTVFTVGDQKQSIYSFQRASPEDFKRMQLDFQHKIEAAKQRWDPVDLNISFRSAPAVLSAVDAVFRPPHMREGLSDTMIEHISFRRRQAGLVELWPLFAPEDVQEIDPWTPPVEIIERASGPARLAEHLADTIAGWLRDGEILPSKNRPVQAGDIMILVRTRTAFVNQLMRALKTRNIPVSGVDRMILNEQLVVEDLMALMNFALLPDDDLTLACILKSPLIGLDEEALYDLAATRTQSLWGALQQSAHTEITAYLKALVNKAGHESPYGFLSDLLYRPCPGDSRSGIRAIKGRLGDDAMDALEELLSAALQYEQQNIPCLQGFARWHEKGRTEVKRELGEHSNQLRIMTVHGAKGLQAPIVILPDTIRTSRSSPTQTDKRLLWPDKTGLETPLWSPRKAYDPAPYQTAMERLDEKLEQEYRRLLYVAMTRAEDRFYVTGHTGVKKPLEDSWYFNVKAGLEALEETQMLDDGCMRLSNPQSENVQAADEETGDQTDRYAKAPDWLLTAAPQEAEPAAKLRPSRPGELDDPVISPLQGAEEQRFRRGNITHKFLEILPDLPPQNRAQAAATYLEQYGDDLDDATREGIIRETLAILDHPDFAPIFGQGSQAEVPVSGTMKDGRLISGQIDRLLVTDTTIHVIDYKTNRPPPRDPADIPALYKSQLQAYADALRAIYPGRELRCALLWTDGPRLMPVDIA